MMMIIAVLIFAIWVASMICLFRKAGETGSLVYILLLGVVSVIAVSGLLAILLDNLGF